MPTAQDVTTLRKAGQLAEAFTLATDLLAAEPDNVWNKRAIGWVRYERLKAVAKSNKPDEFMEEWIALSALVADNPADETMLTNSMVWQVVVRLFALPESTNAIPLLDVIFASVQDWTFERPSDMYSALLRSVLRTGKTWPGLYNFLTWWQLSNLRPEYYLPGLTNEGKKMMSLAEQVYITYAKQVLLHPEPAQIRALTTDLDTLHEQHPEYQYPPYYQAKLLVATGSKDEAMTALLPFARRKQSEFWLWDLLAELYGDEPEKAIACLCRAVTCRTEDKFLVNARLNLANKLIVIGKPNEALTELTKLIKTRSSEGWKINAETITLAEKLAGEGAMLLADNRALYRQYRPLADELLYADTPEQIGVITFLNTDKKVAHFSIDRTVSSHFKYEDKLARIQPGDFVAVRLEERTGKEGKFWIPLSARLTDQMPSKEICKSFSGSVKRVEGKGFGFVDDIFIPPALLSESGENSVFTGSALWSFDKLKNKHGWKAISAISAT